MPEPSATAHARRRASSRERPRGEAQARHHFMARALAALEDLAGHLDAPTMGLLSEPASGYGVLLGALEQPRALEALRREDPLAAARVRGLRLREELLNAEGGAIGASETAARLHITRQAVDKRRRAGKLLAVELGRRRWLYPTWQVQDGQVLPGLEEVLSDLSTHDPWMQLGFFLSGDYRLGERTPLDALRQGRLADVRTAARAYGEHGAA
jgi:hypothetical protein